MNQALQNLAYALGGPEGEARFARSAEAGRDADHVLGELAMAATSEVRNSEYLPIVFSASRSVFVPANRPVLK
jgi:hypothetical protein